MFVVVWVLRNDEKKTGRDRVGCACGVFLTLGVLEVSFFGVRLCVHLLFRKGTEESLMLWGEGSAFGVRFPNVCLIMMVDVNIHTVVM